MTGKKLNILVLCYEYPPIGGGGGVGAMQYAEAWAEAGHQVTVLTSRDKGLQRRERLRGVELIRVPAFGKKNRATATNLSMLCYLAFGFAYLTSHFSVFKKVEVKIPISRSPPSLLAWWLRSCLPCPMS